MRNYFLIHLQELGILRAKWVHLPAYWCFVKVLISAWRKIRGCPRTGRKLRQAPRCQPSFPHDTVYNIRGNLRGQPKHLQHHQLFCTFQSVLSESKGAPPFLLELRERLLRSLNIASYRGQARQASPSWLRVTSGFALGGAVDIVGCVDRMWLD